ncbi:hypothetical protein F5887DRAFT_1290046 [Amanita rubescens]|nr:hypothetical protein F5887DRAFT_1290046 [Amanita rubescens]
MNGIQRSSSKHAQQSTGFFSHAHDFQINNSLLYDASQNVHYHDDSKGQTDLEHLQQFISDGALHDSMARFPPPMCHPATREKVLEIITNWINDPHPAQRIIWLNGPAGAGKSAIAQTIAGHCSDEQLAASFFFLRNSSDRGNTTRLFATLAWQFAKNIPEILPYIELAIKEERLLPTKSVDIQFEGLIVKPFNQLLRDKPDFRPQKSLVIIDGLDECAPDRDQLLLLRFVGNPRSDMQIPLRFLICSRPEAHIQAAFGTDDMIRITLPVLLDDKFNPDDDIRSYLEDEFTRICNERGLSLRRWPPDDAIDKLISKSSGQFIYAATVIKFVDDMYGDPRTQLDIIMKIRSVRSVHSSPFAELDQLYIQILSHQPDVKFLRNLFALIIGLRYPLIGFACRRLRISKEELELKLLRLRSLVHISGTFIETYHLSLHDFFRDKKRAGRYFIHPMRVGFVRLLLTPRVQPQNIMLSVLFNPLVLAVAVIALSVPTLGLGPALLMEGLEKFEKGRHPFFSSHNSNYVALSSAWRQAPSHRPIYRNSSFANTLTPSSSCGSRIRPIYRNSSYTSSANTLARSSSSGSRIRPSSYDSVVTSAPSPASLDAPTYPFHFSSPTASLSSATPTSAPQVVSSSSRSRRSRPPHATLPRSPAPARPSTPTRCIPPPPPPPSASSRRRNTRLPPTPPPYLTPSPLTPPPPSSSSRHRNAQLPPPPSPLPSSSSHSRNARLPPPPLPPPSSSSRRRNARLPPTSPPPPSSSPRRRNARLPPTPPPPSSSSRRNAQLPPTPPPPPSTPPPPLPPWTQKCSSSRLHTIPDAPDVPVYRLRTRSKRTTPARMAQF